MENDFEPLSLNSYSAKARMADQKPESTSLAFPLLGLFGETGSLLSEVKKKQRDNVAYKGYASAVAEELGDVLWYLNALCLRAGVKLSEIANYALDNSSQAQQDLAFSELQPRGISQSGRPTQKFEKTLLRLASEVGSFVSDERVSTESLKKDEVVRYLSAILKALISASDEAGTTLEAAAIKNLWKISDRWPSVKSYPPFFDATYPKHEQLPRKMDIAIFEREVAGNVYVFQQARGINIGDRLTDNSTSADDYRFHDVFHYAYIAVLGWSPVSRSLLRLKRKSVPKIDEAEDGARAALIEEGITTWVFGRANDLELFENMKAGDLPFTMLKQIRDFVTGYEAEQCPLWLWEDAILQGYNAFRYLRKNRRALIQIDMEERKLHVEELRDEP